MPERRMFTQKIVDSDAFLDMPLSTQALYFHLNMRADDDGFVNNPKRIQRLIGASEDDLKILIGKRFLLVFESGVVVIKHWRMHNLLRKDRYNPTQYQEELESLAIKENGAYTERTNQLTTEWQPDGNQMATQERIGKDNKGKDNNILPISAYETEFEEVWKAYPRKVGKTNAMKAYVKARKAGTAKETIEEGLKKYLAYIENEKITPQYVKHGSSWFFQKGWEDEYEDSTHKKRFEYERKVDYSDFVKKAREG